MSKYRFDQIAINSKAKKKPTEEDKYHYIGLEHIDSQNLTVSRWGSEVTPKGEKLLMKKGDVLFGKRRAYQKKVAIAPFDGIFSAHGMVLRPNEEVIDKNFFPMFISSDYFLDAAIAISVGSLSPTINWKDLARLEFDLPPMEEQGKLAEVLWSINDTLQAYQNLLTQTDALVQAQFVEMFGDFEINSMGWPVKFFKDFADIDATMTTDFKEYAYYPHIGIESIEKNSGLILDYRTVEEDEVKSAKYLFTPKHIIYSKIRPNLNKVALPDFDGLCSADAYPILPKEGICNRLFLATVLRSEFFLSYVLQFSSRSQMPKVNRKQILGFKMPLPPIQLQNEFGKVTLRSNYSKLALQNTITSLQATKRSILEGALGTGRKE